MSFSISDAMDLLSQALQNYLSSFSLQELAKAVGFVQCTSNYQAQDLMALCVWLSQVSSLVPKGLIKDLVVQQYSFFNFSK